MKTLTWFVLLIFGLSSVAVAGVYYQTPADLYAKSLSPQMRAQLGYTAAEVRAEEYRRMYRTCNEHHECTYGTVAKVEIDEVQVPSEGVGTDQNMFYLLRVGAGMGH